MLCCVVLPTVSSKRRGGTAGQPEGSAARVVVGRGEEALDAVDFVDRCVDFIDGLMGWVVRWLIDVLICWLKD